MGIRKFDVMDLGKASLIKPEQLGYKDSLDIIKDESNKIQKSFVKIGWYLKHIRDNKLYSEGGYANIWECAADQLGYSQPTASRFINICEKFSKDHNSPELDDKYAGFDKSQMIEMLPMEQEQLDRVSPDMTVKQIRDIKMENKNPGKKADQEIDDNIPGQTSIETDFPEYMPEEDLKEDMMDVYATSHKEENSATSEKNSNESKRKPDLRGLTDNPYCKSCGTPLREYEEKCSVCGQLQDWEGYDQDIDPDAKEIIDGDYREIEVSDPEGENIATSQPEEDKVHDESWFVEQYTRIFPDEAKALFEICCKERNNSDRAKAVQKHIAPYGLYSCGHSKSYFSFYGFSGGMDFRIGGERMHLKYGRFVIELMKLMEKEVATSQTGEGQQEEKLSPYGLSKTVYPEGSLIATEGCGHLHNCFSCAQDCAIRQKDRYCNGAPMGNPFSCTTMQVLENIRSEIGEQCQFINLDIAEQTAGSHEPDPCCKKCNNGSCGYRCRRSVVSKENIQQKLPALKNNDQRKEWLANYKSWGLWYRDENIDVNYYKYDFIDGSRLVVAEYPQRLTYYSSEYRDEHYYHLLEKNKQGYKKPYDEQYRQQTDSETYLVEFLKDLQKKG